MTQQKFTWKQMFSSLWYFLEGKRTKYLFWNTINFTGNLSSTIIALIVGIMIDFFTNYQTGQSLTPFYTYSALIMTTFITMSIMRIGGKRHSAGIAIEVQHEARVKGFEKLMEFSLKWHDKENTGNKIEKIDKGARALKNTLHGTNQQIIRTTAAFLGIIGVFAAINTTFLGFFLIYLTIFGIIEYHFAKKFFIIARKRNKAQEQATGAYYEGANNVVSIKSLGIKNKLTKNISQKEKETKYYALKNRDLWNAKTLTINITNGIAMGIYFLLLGGGILAGELTVGFIAIAFSYLNTTTKSMFRIGDVIPQLIHQKANIERMMTIFRTKEEKYFGKETFPEKWKNIKLNNLNFAYEKKGSLKNVSTTINKNETVGIVGPSGSGKSTLSKILLGLYKINKGNITIGEKNYYDIQHKKLLENISPVMQETELFNKSIKENITMTRKMNKKLFEKAITIAQLKPVINKLPQGIETTIGEKGYKLSGGERQRVGIARALYKNPQILILDEATSALDTKTEEKIHKALTKIRNKTIIIIAHRLSTLKEANKIIVFKKGKITEQNTYKKLATNKTSTFYKMLQRQKKN